MTYPLPAKILAAYSMTEQASYQRLADRLNKEGIPPPRSKNWSRWAARGLCLSIGRPSPRYPKTDLSRLTVNRALNRLVSAIPVLSRGFTPSDLTNASGLSATTCRKYFGLVTAIAGGDIVPAQFTDCFEMWNYWKHIGTNDEEAAPV